MNLIELHFLQSFPVTCLNRDDLGAPKSAIFGGSQRGRISSQCLKRSIRNLTREQTSELFAGKRTRFIISTLEKTFLDHDCSPADSKMLATVLADTLGKLDNSGKGDVKTLLYFSPLEMESMATNLVELGPERILQEIKGLDPEDKKEKSVHEKARKELAKLAGKAVKGLKQTVKDKADIAIFGRMVADDHSLMVEGAGLFSHALSTHPTDNEIDFFSAVDDEKSADMDRGAGHIGTIEFNSACYYRYVGLNVDLLFDGDHLGHFNTAERNAVLQNFLQAAVLAVPTAHKNSMFGWNPPEFALGLKRTGQPLALFNAFEKPIRSSDGYLEQSIKGLQAYWETIKERFCLSSTITNQVEMPPEKLDAFIEQLL
jgi:CRISPR system Cascade subunit CasC